MKTFKKKYHHICVNQSKRVPNGFKWHKKIQHGPKWSTTCPKWSNMVQNNPKFLLKMTTVGVAAVCKTAVGATEIRNNLKFWIIIKTKSTIILWWSFYFEPTSDQNTLIMTKAIAPVSLHALPLNIRGVLFILSTKPIIVIMSKLGTPINSYYISRWQQCQGGSHGRNLWTSHLVP